MMHHESHGRNRVRLLAMHHIQSGKTFKEISAIVMHHWQTVQSWLRRFRNDGFKGLFESQRCGAPRKLSAKQESAIFDKINELSTSKTGGYITGKELHSMLIELYGAKCALRTVYNTIHRLGFSWITSRSIHPKSNQEIQDEYKKNSRIY
jgi:transposase